MSTGFYWRKSFIKVTSLFYICLSTISSFEKDKVHHRLLKEQVVRVTEGCAYGLSREEASELPAAEHPTPAPWADVTKTEISSEAGGHAPRVHR